jgi:putative transposase
MTTTLDDVTTRKNRPEPSAEQQAAAELVRLDKEQGLSLTRPDGLLKQFTKTVLETTLNEEMSGHLGYEKHDPAGAGYEISATGPGRSMLKRLRTALAGGRIRSWPC